MTFKAINPATGERLREYPKWDGAQLEQALQQSADACAPWAELEIGERARMMSRVSDILMAQRDEFARVISLEMGKCLIEACTEVEKCAWVCRFYAEHGPRFLADESIDTGSGESIVTYQPLGTILAVMPWNYPFWQVFRFAAPTLMAGNTGVLKHADNVPGCALAIEDIFLKAGFPPGVFRTLMIDIPSVKSVIQDPRIRAVSLTGSERAGKAVASQAGEVLKKAVLELGGSDAFVVLEDADLNAAVEMGVKSRYQNSGQSCIAAKRFILLKSIANEFLGRFVAKVKTLKTGDPLEMQTTLGPLARGDLRDTLHAQVKNALQNGASALTGGKLVPGRGSFYEATVLSGVKPGMRAWSEELFGPVASVITANDEEEALEIANSSNYGLGGSVWTADRDRGEAFARRLASGSAFVNAMVSSDPHLPFGGIKQSGYGRELSRHGMLEFVNVKTLKLA